MSAKKSSPYASTLNFEQRIIDNHLSRYQLAAMKIFWDESADFVLPVRKGLEIDQRTFPWLARRGYLEYVGYLNGFRCTKFGWWIKDRWETTTVWKEEAAEQFGTYLRSIDALSGSFKIKTHKRSAAA